MLVNQVMCYRYFFQSFWSYPYIYNFCYVVTLFLIMILGYFQVAGMLELALNMIYLNNPEKADQAVKLTFRVILVV